MKRADLIIRKADLYCQIHDLRKKIMEASAMPRVPDRIANGSVQVVHDWKDSMWRAPSLPCVVSLSEHLSLRELEQRHEKLKMIYQQLI